MGRYDSSVRCAQIRELIEEKQYLEAMEEIEELRFEEVPTITDLYLFANLFLKAEKMDIAKELYYTVYHRTSSRPALYRLLMLTIRMGDLEEAKELYQAYEIVSGMTLDTYELKYRLAKAEGASYETLIEILEELKKNEYTEEWGYQLARLYELQGRRENCIAECEDLMLWFGSGKIVEKAKELRESCLNPLWQKPNWEEIPEPEEPEDEEEVKVAYAPAQVMDIASNEKPQPEPEIQPAVLGDYEMTGEPVEEPVAEEVEEVEEEPVEETEEEEANEKPVEETVTEEVKEEPVEETETEELVEEPEAEEPIEESVAEEVEEEPVEETVAEEAVEETEVEETISEENEEDSEKTEGESDEEEAEEADHPKKKGFINRLINYFKVDLDTFDDEDDFPEELDTDKQETTEELDAKAIVAKEAQEIMETAAAGEETEDDETEEKDEPKVETAVRKQTTTQLESLEDQLEEMKEKRKVINLEDTMNLDKIRIKSHPLSGRPMEVEVCEDVSVNGITYCTLKTAIKKMPQEERTIHFALTGAAPGISLAVAKKLFKELKKNQYFEAKNIGKIQAEKLDEVDLEEWIEKFIGGCMYIENAPALSEESVEKIREMMAKYGKRIVIVLEGDYEKLDDFLGHHRNLEKQICYKIRL